MKGAVFTKASNALILKFLAKDLDKVNVCKRKVTSLDQSQTFSAKKWKPILPGTGEINFFMKIRSKCDIFIKDIFL